MPEASSTSQEAGASRRRERRCLKWSFRALIVIVAVWGLLTQSPLTSRIVMSRIRAAIPGVKIEGSAAIGFGGEIKLRDFKLSVPGIGSDAATVVEVKRLFVRPNIRKLLGFKGASGPMIHSIEADRPLVRVSQSVEDGTLNIASLERPAPSNEEALLPQIIVRDGALEIGEHRGTGTLTRYEPLKRLSLDGLLVNAADHERGAYELVLRQSSPTGLEKREMTLTGRLRPQGVSLSLRGLTLEDFPPASIPSRLRETFEFLQLQGKVSQTTFDYDQQKGTRVRLDLDGVAVNLPVRAAIEPREGPVPESSPLRMSAVNGWVSFEHGSVLAELHGMLEDLPYQVKVDYKGLEADAPFECDFVCENFRLEEKPQILRFAPATARYRITQFGNPTGIVTARAKVKRGPPIDGASGPIAVEGTLSFKDGVAAYERFPYRFRNLTGVVQFDDHTINILHIEGDAPTGARIQASAHISPLTDEAKVHVEVNAQDVPLDAVFEQALGQSRKRLITEVCSDRQYERLVAAGYLLSPARAYELRQKLDEARAVFDAAIEDSARTSAHTRVLELERALEAPVFVLRGKGDVTLVIDRAEGFEPNWTELIDVRLGKVGVMPDRFPYPIETEGVHVIIDGETVKVGGGTWRGIGGGEAQVEASMVYPTLEKPDIDPMPQVTVEATQFPADERLYGAIAGAIERGNDDSLAPGTGDPTTDSVGGWVVRALSELGLNGHARVSARVTSTEEGTSVDARSVLDGLTSTPRSLGDAEGPVIAGIKGEVLVQDDRVTIDLGGRLGPQGDRGDVGVHAVIDSSARDAEFVGPLPQQTWEAVVRTPALDVSLPIEHVVRAFSPKVASTLDELRSRFQPRGSVDVAARLGGGPGETSVALAEISNASGLSAAAFGGVVSTPSSAGRVTVEGVDAGVLLHAVGVRAPLILDGEQAGTLSLDGTWSPDGVGERIALRVGIAGARFESKATRKMVEEKMPRRAADAVLQARPEGEFDAIFNIRTGDPSRALDGEIRPRSLAIELPTGRINWREMNGSVEFDGASGVLRELTGACDEEGGNWSFQTSGSWIVTEDEKGASHFSLKTDVRGKSEGLPQGLLAVLPDDLTDVLEELDAKVEKNVTLDRATITWNDDGTEGGKSVSAEGELSVDGLSIDAGVPITGCIGTLSFAVDRPAGKGAEFELWSMLDSFRVSDVQMTNGRMRAEGRASGTTVLPLITADCYGGRMSGSVEISPGPGDAKAFTAGFVFSGVRFAPVLRDQTGIEHPDPASATSSAADRADVSRGVMDAQVSLGGIVGDTASRRGRGSLIVGGGPVVSVPLLLPLIQFSNLQLPMGERLEWATGSFYIDGPVVAFEEVLVESASVQLYGYGTVTWPDMALDMRFNSRALRQMPVVNWLLEGVRNELISTKVGGTLGKPDINTVPLAGAGEFFGRIFSGARSEQEQRMEDIERRFERGRNRSRGGAPRPATAEHADRE